MQEGEGDKQLRPRHRLWHWGLSFFHKPSCVKSLQRLQLTSTPKGLLSRVVSDFECFEKMEAPSGNVGAGCNGGYEAI